MVSDPKVFDLIRSLTPTEKRFYTFFSSREDIGKTNPLTLFGVMCKAIAKLAKYPEWANTSARNKDSLYECVEEWIQKRLREGKPARFEDNYPSIASDMYQCVEAWIRAYLEQTGEIFLVNNFPSIKEALYQNVLKVMRLFNSRKNKTITLREMLDDIRFILGRGLYKQAEAMIQDAKKIARHYELYRLLLDILELERQLIYDRSERGLAGKMKEVLREIDNASEHASIGIKLQILYHQLFVQLRLYLTGVAVDVTIVRQVEEDPLLMYAESLEKFTVLRWYYGIMSILHRIKNDVDKRFCYENKLVALWEEYYWQKDDDPQGYMRMLNNFAELCVNIRKWDCFHSALKNLRDVKCRTVDDRAEQFQDIAHLMLKYCCARGIFFPSEEDLRYIQDGLVLYEKKKSMAGDPFDIKGKVNPSRSLSIRYNLTALYLIGGAYPQSRAWLDEILDRKKYEVRLDIRIMAHLLEPIIHYELDRNGYKLDKDKDKGKEKDREKEKDINDVLESCCRTAERFIKNERIKECEREKEYNPEKDCTGAGKLHEYERKFFSFVKRLLGIIDEKKKKQEAEKVKKSIHNYLDKHSGQPPLVQEILLWLESIITGRPMADLFREQLQDSAEDGEGEENEE